MSAAHSVLAHKLGSREALGPFVSSRYNFLVPVEEEILLYNANSGAVLKLSGADAGELAAMLCRGVFEIEGRDLPEQLIGPLCDGMFLVPRGTDELTLIRDRFWRARSGTPMVVTLTTTMNCNLGCYYCYETRSGERLGSTYVEAIVSWVAERLAVNPPSGLHVDWYGGEPLLNPEFIESASKALQQLCAGLTAPYSASIISNGTAWPDDCGAFIERHKIRQVQISFDGLSDNHNQRRHYRRGFLPDSQASSFDRVVELVDRLLDHCRVDIRVNLDRRNQTDLQPFVEFARGRGWFSRSFPAVIQPARLASFSQRAAFMGRVELDLAEYDSLREKLRSSAGCDVQIEESEVPDGFPYPKTSVCAALANRSFVVGADGLNYRCGLQVGEKHRAVGRISVSARQTSDPQAFTDSTWWEAFDPTLLPNCSRCSFLPICWGGCPKRHLEGDAHALQDQSVYWRQNLPRLVAARFGLVPPDGFAYAESEQFR